MKVAVYFATGYEELEALSVVDVLRRAKVEVIMVGVDGQEVTSGRNIKIKMDTTIEAFDYNEVDMLVLPGGVPGVNHLAASEKVMESIKNFKLEGKWLAAICAAPSILGQAGLLKGESATCYPGYEDQLIGCEHVSDLTVVSGKIITGKGAGASLHFALKILEVIKGSEVADEVARGMLIK